MKKPDHKSILLKKIQSGSAVVGIIGLGYVGLPLALAFTGNSFKVLGFDVDSKKTKALERGECYISHIDAAKVKQAVKSKKLSATSDFSRLNEPDAIIICVPTPLTAQRDPDMSYIIKTAGQVKNCLRPGQLIVLESTTYPGTTEELVKGMLEETGLVCCRDFFLAFSPEREDPGNANYSTTTIPKIVGGLDQASGDLAQAAYEKVIQKTVRVKNARTAEAVKLTENIFRAINIAMVNELKIIYERMGIDIWDVLDAAATTKKKVSGKIINIACDTSFSLLDLLKAINQSLCPPLAGVAQSARGGHRNIEPILPQPAKAMSIFAC